MPITYLDHPSTPFPPPECALQSPNGLLAIGGDLHPSRLLNAYQRGVFPWYSPNEPILWWSPDPRAVLLPKALHISHSMAKFLRHSPFKVTLNQAFKEVIHHCAKRTDSSSWISVEMQQAYYQLHCLGHAHSVEVWQQNTLVGGLYGVALGRLFCGESMFSLATNASKVALITFCQYFISWGGALIDCQILNSHTQSLGATTISRQAYLENLRNDQVHSLIPGCWQPKKLITPSGG